MHNYLIKAIKAVKAGNLAPGLHKVVVAHDDWCNFFKGGDCNCSPDLVKPTGEPWPETKDDA